MENLSKEDLLDILNKLDLENTKVKPDTIEKPSKSSLEQINSSELNAKGKPRKRTITEKQLETFRKNGEKRSEASKIRKANEQELLEQLKAEEEAKLAKKLARKAKTEVIMSVKPSTKGKVKKVISEDESSSEEEEVMSVFDKPSIREQVQKPIRTAVTPNKTNNNTQKSNSNSNNNSVSLQDYLKSFGL